MTSQLEVKGVCPMCGTDGDLDPDGFYCPQCDDYLDKLDYEDYWESQIEN